MADWKHQYPSSTLSRKYDQVSAYADLFRGEGNKLLYELKNLMKFRNLGQLKMTRLFTDGTVITAWSVFGQDFVNIDVSRAIVGISPDAKPSCTITFIDLPDLVQPMKYPGEIHEGEVQGKDYIKTYYTVEVKNCGDCQDIVWKFLFTYSTPVESRHFHNYASIPQMGVDPGKDDLNNHIVYSLEAPCWAEIISQGSDSGGTYIIWKAYTEMGDVTYSRTGLAVPLLRAIINNADGSGLCRQEKKFDVDCCRKEPDLRKVEIWWEGIWTCEPFIIYKDYHICKMPSSVPIGGSGGLIAYSTPFYAAKPLYSIPDIKGGCLPLTWSVSGPIRLINPDPMGGSTYFQIDSDIDCHSSVIINLADRCGTEDQVIGTPCCDEAGELSISYVSLLMSCSQSQTFSAHGGCAPYLWSITSGGGTITEDGTYTAPATNENCTDNPTIQVTDCCGNSAQVQLAVNCYAGADVSLKISNLLKCCCYKLQNPNCGGVTYNRVMSQYLQAWRCDGEVLQACWTGSRSNCGGVCPPPPPCTNYCACDSVDEAGCWGTPGYSVGDCTGSGYDGFDTMTDVRTADMKTNGCCPLNPLTGLPY